LLIKKRFILNLKKERKKKFLSVSWQEVWIQIGTSIRVKGWIRIRVRRKKVSRYSLDRLVSGFAR
jgi:hypothetical protein